MSLFSAAKRFLIEDDGQGNTEYIILIGVVALRRHRRGILLP